MSTEQWLEGLSRTSIGRFGGLTEDLIPYNNGYLTANATATRLYLADREGTVELGWYHLPNDFRQETRASWVSMQYRFATADGQPHSTVTRSLLFPGFHHAVHNGRFEYYWRISGFGPTQLVLPLAEAVRVGPAPAGYDAARDGQLAAPWVLFSFAGSAMPFDYPMMFAFDRRPLRIELWTQEYLKILFDRDDATVVQIHPFGVAKLDKQVTGKWAERFPDEDKARMDRWAAAALAYPSGCREQFRVDEDRGVLKVRNEFEYEESSSDWGVRPLHLAPIPPMLANSRRYLCEGEVAVAGEILPELCPTYVGWYEAVAGKSLEYEIPLSRFRNHTLAPMRVENNPLAGELTGKLTEYLTGGEYLTFGGDRDYQPECSLDSLHDLRILAWSLWSIDENKRPQVLDLLTRGLQGLPAEDFLEFQAPRTGTAWARHRSFFHYRGVVDYDCEWYNGMNLAGLWCYCYFGTDEQAVELVRKRWPLVRKLFAYYQAFTDWAIQSVWTSARGELVWLDGVNYAYEGVLAFAALARRIGAVEDARWGDYLAARYELFVRTCWNSVPYMRRFSPKADAEQVVASGWFECQPTECYDLAGHSCGVYGYAVRELLVLLRDMDKQGALAGALERFEQRHPRWRRRPYETTRRPQANPGEADWAHGELDRRRAVHHYFLDPRLMVSALILGEDASALTDVGAPLTGPVLECFLTSMAPLLLVPRDAQFLGAVWDDRGKTLRLRLSADGPTTVALAHAREAARTVPAPVEVDRREGRVLYRFDLSGPTDIVFEFEPASGGRNDTTARMGGNA